MKVLIVYAHPYEKSLNNAVLNSAIEGLKEAGHTIDLIDLNKDNFNPVMSKEALALYNEGGFTDDMVSDYQKRIKDAQFLIFIFPIWWTSLPAILKGFIDKVFLKNFAFTIKGKFPKGLIKHVKGSLTFTTMGSPKFYYKLATKQVVKQVLIKGTLKFCGIKNSKWLPLGNVSDNISKEKCEKWLNKVKQTCKNI